MNQKGEITLVSCLLILAFASVVLLCSLELRKSFNLLQKRTDLFLCVKETKEELNQFMKFMGRTNWAIKNINRVSLVMMFIPGLQGAAMDAKKVKKYIQYVQNGRVISYLKTLKDLRDKSCSLDPRMLITPFKLRAALLQRDAEGAAILRKEKWAYYFLSKPYLIGLTINATAWERIHPKINFMPEEKGAKLSSLYSYP